MSIESTTTAPDTRLHTLPPIECAPWCEDGTGHTTASAPEDQACMSAEFTVPLLRHKPTSTGTDGLVLDNVSAYLIRNRFEAEAHIDFSRSDSTLVELTLSEALALAQGLLSLREAAGTGVAPALD